MPSAADPNDEAGPSSSIRVRASRSARNATSASSAIRESRPCSPSSPDRTPTRAAHTACRPAIRRTVAGPGDLADDAHAASAQTADATAISLAIAAAQSGRRVNYGALADLITSLSSLAYLTPAELKATLIGDAIGRGPSTEPVGASPVATGQTQSGRSSHHQFHTRHSITGLACERVTIW